MILTESEILNASILIVDDQEANIDLLEQLLGEAGYTRVSFDHEPAGGRAPCIARTATT